MLLLKAYFDQSSVVKPFICISSLLPTSEEGLEHLKLLGLENFANSDPVKKLKTKFQILIFQFLIKSFFNPARSETNPALEEFRKFGQNLINAILFQF